MRTIEFIVGASLSRRSRARLSIILVEQNAFRTHSHGRGYLIEADTGGRFTDLAVFDAQTGETRFGNPPVLQSDEPKVSPVTGNALLDESPYSFGVLRGTRCSDHPLGLVIQ